MYSIFVSSEPSHHAESRLFISVYLSFQAEYEIIAIILRNEIIYVWHLPRRVHRCGRERGARSWLSKTRFWCVRTWPCSASARGKCVPSFFSNVFVCYVPQSKFIQTVHYALTSGACLTHSIASAFQYRTPVKRTTFRSLAQVPCNAEATSDKKIATAAPLVQQLSLRTDLVRASNCCRRSSCACAHLWNFA